MPSREETHMRKPARLVLGVMFGAVALAACGESDEDKVRSVVESFVLEGDPSVCDQMTTEFAGRIWGGVDACKASLEGTEPNKSARIRTVVVDGDTATATAAGSGGFHTRYELVKSDGAWRLDRHKSLRRPPKAPRPRIQKGLDGQETVEAYYQAIMDGDGAAFCGLLSRGYALEVLRLKKADKPRSECVAALTAYDWSEPQDQAEGVSVADVNMSGRKGTVTLSNGKRALLRQDAGRWVIDDIKERARSR
jgi:hypothetical protein